MKTERHKKSSKKARLTAARLAAVQAVYQARQLDKKPVDLIDEYISYRLGEPVEGEEMVLPDGVLFSAILENVSKQEAVLLEAITAALTHSAPKRNHPESLLEAILLCGGAELLFNIDTDSPIIISDYLDVTHAFYDQNEAKLVNAILDRLSRVLRD